MAPLLDVRIKYDDRYLALVSAFRKHLINVNNDDNDWSKVKDVEVEDKADVHVVDCGRVTFFCMHVNWVITVLQIHTKHICADWNLL